MVVYVIYDNFASGQEAIKFVTADHQKAKSYILDRPGWSYIAMNIQDMEETP